MNAFVRLSDRTIRIAAALLIAAGLAASGLAILAEELGVGTEATEGIFGWKQIALLVAGTVAVALGALLFACPRIASRLISSRPIAAAGGRGSSRRWHVIAGSIAVLALLGGLSIPWLTDRLSEEGNTELEPVGEYSQPVYVTSDPDDPDRLFVVEREGTIMLTAAGRTSTFLDQREITSTEDSERGLLSVAFPPDFAKTRRFYVFYTNHPDGSLRVDELLADGEVADPESRRNVLSIPHPHVWHNGGQLEFGPDGYLYVATGDGGIGEAGIGDPDGNGQDPTTLLGALLRIDPRQSGAEPYTIPLDNPYVGTENAEEIWSWGLRNPWRFSFDRETAALTIADAGQDDREEINYRPQDIGGGRGDNFGWNCREGSIAYPEPSVDCQEVGPFIDPVFDYPNSIEEGGADCAVIGGYVVRDPSLTDLYGRYLYSDYCTGDLRSILLDVPLARDNRSEELSVPTPTSFGEDACGRTYVASQAGPIYRLVGEGEPDCG